MKITNIKLFKNIFTELGKISDEIKFEVKYDELYCAFLNRRHDVFCECSVKCVSTDSHEEYNEFIIDLSEFSNILKNIKNSGELTLTLAESYLDVEYTNGKSKKLYRIGLLESGGAEYKEPPQLEYNMFSISSEFIKESLKDIKLVSTVSCVFTTQGGYFRIGLSEPTMMLMEYNNSIQLDTELEDHQSTYAMDLLELLLNFKEINEEINIGFITDYPLKLKVENDEATIEGLVAPRVEESKV